jgi:hypothetical protein
MSVIPLGKKCKIFPNQLMNTRSQNDKSVISSQLDCHKVFEVTQITLHDMVPAINLNFRYFRLLHYGHRRCCKASGLEHLGSIHNGALTCLSSEGNIPNYRHALFSLIRPVAAPPTVVELIAIDHRRK